ncbi:hypothetical protein [Phenylobacterium sp.]|jgi:hypothetical protein|uniref:hypothetical protein n=1 Tax=Phenylobacterium sp. TaxID=1871053 RepID=UPI002F3EBB49
MLFLLNDVVLETRGVRLPPRLDASSLEAMPFESLQRMGQELFAEDPRLQYDDTARARRLAALIAARAPGVNAALFVAPAFDAAAEDVHAQFATVDDPLMADLEDRQREGRLDMVAADRRVWRRLSA